MEYECQEEKDNSFSWNWNTLERLDKAKDWKKIVVDLDICKKTIKG